MAAYCVAVARSRFPPAAAERDTPSCAAVAIAALTGSPAAMPWAAAPTEFSAPKALPIPC